MGLPKVEVKTIEFTKDAKTIEREELGKIIKKGTIKKCSGKALQLYLKAGVAKVIKAPKGETIEKLENDK